MMISRDTSAYYLTSVAHDRLPIFRMDRIKQLICDAFDEARRNHAILIFAYVIMPDHSHLITDGRRSTAETLKLLNGIAAHRLIQHLKANNYLESLQKLRGQQRGRNYKHSVWQHHPNAFEIFGEDTFREKVNYIHQNPVRSGLVDDPQEYRFSSARQWAGRFEDDEPLLTDHRQIKWRSR